MNKKKLMISIDVEAQPLRAERDPLNCLIWGEYPEGRLGISEMMDIADAAGMLIEHSAQETLEIKPPLDYEINNELQEFDIEQEFDELELEPRSLRASKVRRAKTLAEAVADGSLTPRDGAL